MVRYYDVNGNEVLASNYSGDFDAMRADIVGESKDGILYHTYGTRDTNTGELSTPNVIPATWATAGTGTPVQMTGRAYDQFGLPFTSINGGVSWQAMY